MPTKEDYGGQFPNSQTVDLKPTVGIDTVFYIVSAYVEDKGLLQLPSATANGQCEFVQVSAPTAKRVVQWVAQRTGSVPDLPDCDTGDSNEVLMETDIGALNVVPMQDGTPVFTLTGTYVYGCRDVVGKSGIKVSGNPVYRSQGTAKVEQSQFKPYI